MALTVKGVCFQSCRILGQGAVGIILKNGLKGKSCLGVFLALHLLGAQFKQRGGHLHVGGIFAAHKLHIAPGVLHVAQRQVDRRQHGQSVGHAG